MGLCGGMEAGGTKVVCMIGTGPDDIRAEALFATTSPEQTLGKVIQFFRSAPQGFPLEAVGAGSFGPLDLDPASPYYGYITGTPKPGWAQTDLAGSLRRALNLPVALDTDVNAAAYAERRWGAARGLDPVIYVTVGTGIGGGIVSGGKPVHGMVHPEVGHLIIPHDRTLDPFSGVCPYHGDCLEGLASGPALRKRWGQPAETLPADHPAWRLEAHYLALGLANLILSHSPRRIVLGGGVMKQPELFPLIRPEVQRLLNRYVLSPEIVERIEEYIVPPALGDRAGVLGAIALAQDCLGVDEVPGGELRRVL